MSDLMELLERVKAATGPDRELDYAISRFADGELVRHSSLHLPYTASIDDALALVERKLPGQHVTMGQNLHHHYWLCTFNSFNGEGEPTAIAQEMHKSSLPLAILAALLSALTSGASS